MSTRSLGHFLSSDRSPCHLLRSLWPFKRGHMELPVACETCTSSRRLPEPWFWISRVTYFLLPLFHPMSSFPCRRATWVLWPGLFCTCETATVSANYSWISLHICILLHCSVYMGLYVVVCELLHTDFCATTYFFEICDVCVCMCNRHVVCLWYSVYVYFWNN